MGGNRTGVREASESSIEVTFTYRGKRCRERLRLKPTPANLKRAIRFREAVLQAIATGTFDYRVSFPESKNAAQFADRKGDTLSVADFLDAWLKRQRSLLKSSTWNDYYKTIVNHLIPAFGDNILSDLKRSTIREWCATLTASNKRIANLLSPLRVALQEAVDDEFIEANPLYGWSYKRREPVVPSDDIDPFTPAEQAAILDTLEGQARNLLQFAFWSGLRTSEMVALEWGDVDWIKGHTLISRAQTQAADEPEAPKTRAGRRELKLLPPALEAISAQKPYSFLHPSGRVFLNPRTGEPWIGDQAIRRTLWTHALKRAGVRYRRPYQTRHTYASMMLSAGESPMWVAHQMGHADWTMIARVYGRWIPDAAPDAGQKAVAAFARSPSDETKNAGVMLANSRPNSPKSHKK
ncbi:DUF3596 domain-containing protein [Acidithiobacillus sp. MC6.1]|nr:DUF3596 domain-containing protein [Acidithiobacillus sp. MC6.1]